MKTINSKRSIRRWESALVLALCFTICYGVFSLRQQQRLAENVVRLHVVAQSDSPHDQQVKLEVRDSVLEHLTLVLADISDREEASEVISKNLDLLRIRASDISGLPADAVLEYESFPTRYYDSFALPAGEYLSLRIKLGEANGQNWWCVVFPPLCMPAAEESAVEAGTLTDEQIKLITETGGEYVLRFKVLEYAEKIRSFFEQ